ncbi:hypothetical protein AVT69_gp368 [Pseudomonas phage PhiPA3]|uniref:Uncharacterized protein 368 n=1 Tax=Pseudomonas phage PhiPA3 TaxID=998086 RepID=F8SJK0_BPPA3|nr:hypothetical protein AVT69_gp368 [Pseudomonas phage PhiPA3]AEH03791.1 hypothetical protein [Pseudomonas phage PhiPA3]
MPTLERSRRPFLIYMRTLLVDTNNEIRASLVAPTTSHSTINFPLIVSGFPGAISISSQCSLRGSGESGTASIW